MKLVLDRQWLYDYMDRLKQQMRDVEQICDSLESTVMIDNSMGQLTIQDTIKEMRNIYTEISVIYEVLEEYVEGVDEAKRILDDVVQEIHEALSF